MSGQYDPDVHEYNGPVGVSLPWSSPIEFDTRALKNAEIQDEFDFNIDPNSGKPIGVSEYATSRITIFELKAIR